MQLKPEIITVLTTLNADQTEIDNLTSYFSDKLTQAQANVMQIDANIQSLQTQKTEALALVDLLTTAIGKFIVL